MKRKEISNNILLVLPLIYIVIYQLFLFDNLMEYAEYITASFSMILFFLSCALLGFTKNKENLMKKNIKKVVLTYVILFFAITYGSGLFLGFLRNSYSLKFINILNNIISPVLIIICIELFRYNFIRSNKNNLKLVKLVTTIIIIFEVICNIKLSLLNNFTTIFRTTTGVILPIIIKNIIMSFTCYQAGYQSTILYRLLMEIYIYVIPIVPDTGEYMNSMIGIGFPFILYLRISKMLDNYNENEMIMEEKTLGPFDLAAIGCIICFAVICSNMTPYYVLGVVTKSMTPHIRRGDAVVIKKINNKTEIKQGDIISFYQDGREIVHRLVDIREEEEKRCYITKGDANNTEDEGCLEYAGIRGKVEMKIPYIAYPRIIINDYINKEK